MPRKRIILVNGLRRRCPRCGRGRLFRRWLRLYDACSACGLRFLLNQGDPWAFLLIADRAFLLALVAIIYFKLWPQTPLALVALFVTVGGLFVVTMPHRYSLTIALDYWTRTRWGDPSDEARQSTKRNAGT